MRKHYLPLFAAATFIFTACHNDNDRKAVVAERYVHKYGYAVSKEEWEAKSYPGQVIKTMKDGITATATYEDGQLHGPCTNTFAHSQTIESFYLYNKGNLIKEITYDMRGIPMKEVVYVENNHTTTTLWFEDGSPRSIEEHINGELADGQYFTRNHETEARVAHGTGQRIERDATGSLISRETLDDGFITVRETFHPNGSPQSICHFVAGNLHGERREFTPSGEPLAVENYRKGNLHGTSTYFKNGYKYLEMNYRDGAKFGDEIHYLDGTVVSQRVHWNNNRRHGQSSYFINGNAHTKWYYEGMLVSAARFNELCELYYPDEKDDLSDDELF